MMQPANVMIASSEQDSVDLKDVAPAGLRSLRRKYSATIRRQVRTAMSRPENAPAPEHRHSQCKLVFRDDDDNVMF